MAPGDTARFGELSAARAEPGLLVLRLDAPLLFILRRSGLTEAVGEARIYRSLADAIPVARAALRF